MAIGAFFATPRLAIAMADAFLEHSVGDGYEEWDGFFEYHRIGYDECENLDYAEFKANSFTLTDPKDAPPGKEPRGLAF